MLICVNLNAFCTKKKNGSGIPKNTFRYLFLAGASRTFDRR